MSNKQALDALEDIENLIRAIMVEADRNGVTALAKWKLKDQCEKIRASLTEEAVDIAGLMRHLHFKLEPSRLQAVIINTAIEEYFQRPDLASKEMIKNK